MKKTVHPDIQYEGKKFKEIFGVRLSNFMDKMFLEYKKEFFFDIFKFDEWLVTQGYKEEHKSMDEFVTFKWGKDACELIKKIIDV